MFRWVTLSVPLSLLALTAACGDDVEETAQQANCPGGVPVEDDGCAKTFATCTYMDCATFGVATATCRTDALWDVSERACAEFECVNETCGPGQICVVSGSGFPQGARAPTA